MNRYGLTVTPKVLRFNAETRRQERETAKLLERYLEWRMYQDWARLRERLTKPKGT